MVSKVFLTGATGYIGGEVLYKLLNSSHHKFEVTALVRSEAKAAKLKEATGNAVQTVVGDLDCYDIIEDAVLKSDIVINTANVDHVPSAEILNKVLISKKEPTILIHTSGTAVVGDPLSKDKKPSLRVWSDEKSIDDINSIPDENPHRPVDKLVLSISEANPQVKTIVISPSTIFGISHGYDKTNSIQIPALIQGTVKNGRPFTVFTGDYIWSHIHIHDLGDLYELILNKLLAGEHIPEGKKGYYFGALTLDPEPAANTTPTEIEHTWRELSIRVGKALAARKLIASTDLAELDAEAIPPLKDDDPFAAYYWGTNSRTRGDNGYKLGWKPKHTSLDSFWAAIDEDIDHLKL